MKSSSGRAVLLSYNTSWYVWTFRLPLIRALQDRGYRVTVLAPRDDYTERLVAAGVSFQEISLRAKGKNPFQELRTFLSFLLTFRKVHPRAVLLYTIKPNLYGSLAARFLKIPVIANVTGLGAVFDKKGPLQAVIRRLYRAAFARAERVFFQNPDDLRSFIKTGLVSSAQADLLPGSGVDLHRFSPRPRGRGPFMFLFVGRLLKAKGVEDLVSAVRILAGDGRNFRVVLLGKQDDADPDCADPRVLAEAASQRLVELPGNVDDVRPFFADADCIVLPSYYREGTPRSLLEAAAMGKPLIAADSVGTREPVADGVNGYLCRPRDPGDLAAKMRAMYDLSVESRLRMGEASRRIAEERYDEQIVIGKYIQVIEQLAGQR